MQDLLEFVFGPDELVNTKARAHRVLRKLQRDISSVRDEVENILTERGNATEGVIGKKKLFFSHISLLFYIFHSKKKKHLLNVDRNTCRTALCDTIARDRLSVDTSDYTDADIDALVSVLFRGGVDVMAIQVIMTLLFGLEDSVVTGRRSGQL